MRTCVLAIAVSCLVCGRLEAEETILQEAQTWFFLEGWSPPPADWADPDFDAVAAGWRSGPGGIGYGDDDDATVLDDMRNNYISLYLRTDVVVPDGIDGFIASLKVRYDDSFVAYVDGEEVARRNISGYPPSFDQPADTDHEITAPVGFDEVIPLPEGSGLLSAGTHTLAVEMHNATLSSSDLSFAAEVTAAPFTASSVDPAFGPMEGGNVVLIDGLGFLPGEELGVSFGGVASPDVEVLSADQLRVVVPPRASPAAVDVEIAGSRGSMTLESGYRYVEPGQITLHFTGDEYAVAERYGDLSDTGTFEVWVRAENTFARNATILTVADLDGNSVLRLELRRSRLRVRSGVGQDQTTLDPRLRLDSENWHHVAVTFSPQGRGLYIDGRLVGADAEIVQIPEESRLFLGAQPQDTASFAGWIESARVWRVERSASDLNRYRFADLEDEPGLESSWALDEGGGQTSAHRGRLGSDLVLGQGLDPDGSDPEWASVDGFPTLALVSLEPAEGSVRGGNSVRIFGTGFEEDPPSDVYFGARASAHVTFHSAWELEATVPEATAPGTVDVAVETSRGEALAAGAYTYNPEGLVTPVKEGGTWDYFVAFSPPPADWADPDFDPAAAGWPSGPTGIGYGDLDDATDVSEMLESAAAVYARTEWTLEGNVEDVTYLHLKIRYDDSYVAYLNGSEVARANLAGQPPAYDELASQLHEIGGGPGTFDEDLDLAFARDLLLPGRNVLAIEVHNAQLDSSDLSMSAELLVAGTGAPPEALFVRGDVDGSGDLSVTDCIRVLRYLMLGDDIDCLEAADTNDDGTLNITDAVYLLRFLFQPGSPPPPPFPEAGPDTDDDPLSCERGSP